MDFWIALLGIVALIFAYPYIRCFFKRLICAQKLIKICRKKRYFLSKTHLFWFLGGKHSERCDCYIETPTEVFAVKLFGVKRRLTVLMLKTNGEYFIRSFIAFGTGAHIALNSKSRALPRYNFRYSYKDEWEIKTPRNIFLVNPAAMEIRRKPDNGPETIIGAGETVNGMEISTLSRFLGELESLI